MNANAIEQKYGRYSGDVGAHQTSYGEIRGAAIGGAEIGTARQAEIPHQIEKLERTLKGCMQGLDALSAKLEGSVMRSEPPANDSKAEPTALQQTTLGSILQNLTLVAAHLNARIGSMTQRLEV